MKRSLTLLMVIILSMIAGLLLITTQTALAATELSQIQDMTPAGPSAPGQTQSAPESCVHVLYFYANDCPHCIEILEQVLQPLKDEVGDLLDLRLLEISIPEYYEAMLTVENYFNISASQRSIPTLVIDHEILIGETPIRESFEQLVYEGLEGGGIDFPIIEGLDMNSLVSVDPSSVTTEGESCEEDEVCIIEAPLYAAYFYQTGCKECSRVEADLTYLQSQFPQLQVVEFNIYEHADLAAWMVEQVSFERDFSTPAIFIGEKVLLEDEISLETIESTLEDYRRSGTEPIWENFNAEQGKESILNRFRNMGWFTVVAAGLVDGINPCAFATLIFFVSYLTLSGRKGKEVLFVGGAFTLGVFIAYLAVGLGLYQVLEMVSEAMDLISKIVYILTGIFCLVLAVFSLLDFLKARKGQINGMLLKLPEPLRKRINATIRKGRSTRQYIIGAFIAGILISFLELACTGQIYLPTIIFVSSIPELRLQAIFYLVIYNLLFALPLVIIFILVYFGTTSQDLTQFLQKNSALVKLAMSIIFIVLGVWLVISMIL